MSDNVLSLPVAKNCMRLIQKGAASDAFEALGIRNEDFKIACSNEPYIGADRARVTQVLNSLTHGVLDVVGLPRLDPDFAVRKNCFKALSNIRNGHDAQRTHLCNYKILRVGAGRLLHQRPQLLDDRQPWNNP